MEDYKVSTASIIGGADGPTSVFVARKSEDGNLIRRLFHTVRRKIYAFRYKRAAGRIRPGIHTPSETAAYMVKKYGAREADLSLPVYQQMRRASRLSFIRKERPDLLDLAGQPRFPEDREDSKALKDFLDRYSRYEENLLDQADRISEKVFPFRYHVYLIGGLSEDQVQIDLEEERGLVGSSYTGDTGYVVKDIYAYYGVSEEDIQTESERFRSLVAMLMN